MTMSHGSVKPYRHILHIIITLISPFFVTLNPPSRNPNLSVVAQSLNDLVVPDIKVVAIPDPESAKQVKINQRTKITVEFTTNSNHTVLSQLQGSFGQKKSSLQQLLGDHNIACADVYLAADLDPCNIATTQAPEYPLNQRNITWSWIITPKQVELNLFDISFSATGKSVCAAGKDPIVGSYALASADVFYQYNVIGPDNTSMLTATSDPTGTSAFNT